MRQIYNNGYGRTILGRQIKDLRQRHNDAQYETAKRLHITVSRLSQIECGKGKQPTIEELKPLETAYPVKVVQNELGEVYLEKE